MTGGSSNEEMGEATDDDRESESETATVMRSDNEDQEKEVEEETPSSGENTEDPDGTKREWKKERRSRRKSPTRLRSPKC